MEPKPLRVTSSSFLAYAEALLDKQEDVDKIKAFIGEKTELYFDESMQFMQPFLGYQLIDETLKKEDAA